MLRAAVQQQRRVLRWAAVGAAGAAAGVACTPTAIVPTGTIARLESAGASPRRVAVGEYFFDDRVQVTKSVSGSPALDARVPSTTARLKDATEGGTHTSLSLTGPTGKERTCRLTYWTFPIACAALYLPPTEVATASRVLSAAVPKVLKLQYLRAITAKDFRESTEHYIKSNELLSDAVARQLEQFNRLYRDVDVGDSYELRMYRDETGVGSVELALNGDVLGAVRGDEFSTALFSVWFGDHCCMESLKAALTEV
jgi:hypothetical protein